MKLKRSILILFLAVLLLLCGCKKGSVLPKIENGGFENGLSPWYRKAYIDDGAVAEIVSDPDRGGTAHIIASGENDVRLIQELKVTPDTGYRITCMVKTSGVEGGAGANIGVYGVAVSSAALTGTTGWQRIELVGKTAPGQTTLPLSIGIGSHGAVSSGEAWFDDVTIELSENAPTLLGKASEKETSSSSDAPTKFPTGGIMTGAILATIFACVFFVWHVRSAKQSPDGKKHNDAFIIIAILLAAFIARVILSVVFHGHKTDINCFIFWGKRLISNGPAHFYDGWCDYPPGYMLILGLMSWINDLVGGNLTVNSLLIKLPCIIADLGLAYLVYRYSVKRMNRNAAVALMALVAFTPVMAFVSSAWGQIDQALTVTLIVPILLLYKRKPILAGLIYGAGIIMKPQALMCGPLFAAAYFIYVFRSNPYVEADLNKGAAKLFKFKKDCFGLRFVETVLAVFAALALIILVSVPFKGSQDTFWLVEKYYGTATSYKYASVNAYNFWTLIGANWKSVDLPFMGLTYGKWGTIGMAVSVVLGILLYVGAVVRHKKVKGALPLAMAYMLAGIFTFGHYMHERYIFPALILLMFAYIFYNDRRLLWTYMAYAATMLVNCIAAFYYSKLFEYGLYWDKKLIFWCSLVNVAVFVWFTVITFDLVIRNKPLKGFNDEA
ncbi:MAG: hypothetical protein K6G56_06025 [Clostridiales bacterium]|nr:hypothetical protein [Clostridiales bacterium]